MKPRAALLLGLLLAAGAVPPLAAAERGLVASVEVVGMTVRDMDRSVDFFTRVLTFEKVSDVEVAGEAFERLHGVFGARARVVRLRLGDERLELTEYLAPRGRSIPEGARSNDRAFQHLAIIVSDMENAYRRLRDHHTAIVVGDTDASLRFYRDTLGLRLAGESENYGTEQERLNNVFGARLRITALRAEGGPGIEFLEYLAPRDGRPAPADLRANDLAHWQTTLAARAVDALVGALRAFFVSPGAVDLPGPELGFRRGLLVRDPDGHALRLVQP